MASYFEFHVIDAHGYWGDMRAEADTKEIAESAIRSFLEKEEVSPSGSLQPEFRLECFAESLKGGE